MSTKHNIILIFLTLLRLSTTQNGGYIRIGRNLATNCNYLVCPSQQGYCKADKCICWKGYITLPDNFNGDNDEKYCNYKQKNSFTALLWEAFGWIGFGHWYAGRIVYGLLKWVCFYIIICYGTQFVIQFLKENIDTDIAYYIKIITSSICLGTPLVWHFIDLYNWANNNYLDGNHVQMLN